VIEKDMPMNADPFSNDENVVEASSRREQVFFQALEISDVRARQRFLESACAGDSTLKDEINQLLLNDNTGETLEQPALDRNCLFECTTAFGRSHSLSDQRDVYRPGMSIGNYRLVEAIGQGGMGIVWRAEQTAPIQRQVALKLIKPGMDSHTVLTRFKVERQSLAIMDHPNIAKVYDAGTTDLGHPYFVMELVQGEPLTAYCDRQSLSIRQRLALLVDVCAAVQHAHQKGVMHRDLKPNNILVTNVDGQSVPKVIDFGLAKALTGQQIGAVDLTLATAAGTIVGTPLYMAPEQLSGDLDVDTRADQFSLGTIMYELLTGSTPIPRHKFDDANWAEIHRMVCDEEPPRPSVRVSSSTVSPVVAEHRNCDSLKLTMELRGDLDWITMKALDKDRSRRYETINGLAADIRRYLEGEAILAAPPSRTYRFRKLIQRNRLMVGVASLLALVVFGGFIGTAFGLYRANRSAMAERIARIDAQNKQVELARQHARAEQREQQAVDALRSFSDAVANNRELRDMPVLQSLRRDLLQRSIDFFDTLSRSLQSEGGTQPTTLERLSLAASEAGVLSSELGDQQAAVAAFRRAHVIWQDLYSSEPQNLKRASDLAASFNILGASLQATGELAESWNCFQEAEMLYVQLLERDPEDLLLGMDLARCLNNQGQWLKWNGRPHDALNAFERSLEIQEQILRLFPNELFVAESYALNLGNVGMLLRETGDLTTAFEKLQQAYQLQSELVEQSPDSTDFEVSLSRTCNNLSVLYRELGQLDDAIRLLESALEIRQRTAARHPSITQYQRELSTTYNNLGIVYREVGAFTQSQSVHEQAIVIERLLAQSNPTVIQFQNELASGLNNMGLLLLAQDQLEGARVAFNEARQIRQRLVVDYPEIADFMSDLGGTLNNLAHVAISKNQFELARDLLVEAIQWQQQAMKSNPTHPTYRQFLHSHYQNLLLASYGLNDPISNKDARSGLAQLAEEDPAGLDRDALLQAMNSDLGVLDRSELIVLGMRAYELHLFHLSAGFYRHAVGDPSAKLDQQVAEAAYMAACSALLAAADETLDEPILGQSEPRQLRNEALIWLQQALDFWADELDRSSEGRRTRILEALEDWLHDSDLQSIREPEGLEELELAEQQSWIEFWDRVKQMLDGG